MTYDIGDGSMQTGRQTPNGCAYIYIHRNVTIYICRWNDWVLIGLNFNWITDQFNLWVILYTNIPHLCAAAKNLHHWWGRVSTCRRLEWMCDTLQSMPAPERLGWSWCDFGLQCFSLLHHWYCLPLWFYTTSIQLNSMYLYNYMYAYIYIQ